MDCGSSDGLIQNGIDLMTSGINKINISSKWHVQMMPYSVRGTTRRTAAAVRWTASHWIPVKAIVRIRWIIYDSVWRISSTVSKVAMTVFTEDALAPLVDSGCNCSQMSMMHTAANHLHSWILPYGLSSSSQRLWGHNTSTMQQTKLNLHASSKNSLTIHYHSVFNIHHSGSKEYLDT